MISERAVVDGRFELLEPLGSGGMGTVWRAYDLALHREVALKEVRAEADDSGRSPGVHRERVLREARALARIGHPNVVAIHHIVDSPEVAHPWIVMELVRGKSLADHLAVGPMPPTQVAQLGRGILAALRAAHQVGVLHRDIKPANVLLREDGSPVLTDFGIAAINGMTALTSTGSVVGSLDYVAPERLSGQEGHTASDLWSLGLLLYFAVEGFHPMRRESTVATLAAVIKGEVPPPQRAGVLTAVLTALLVPDPSHRPTAEQVDRMLAQAGGFAGAAGTFNAQRGVGGFGAVDSPGAFNTPGPAGRTAAFDSHEAADTPGAFIAPNAASSPPSFNTPRPDGLPGMFAIPGLTSSPGAFTPGLASSPGAFTPGAAGPTVAFDNPGTVDAPGAFNTPNPVGSAGTFHTPGPTGAPGGYNTPIVGGPTAAFDGASGAFNAGVVTGPGAISTHGPVGAPHAQSDVYGPASAPRPSTNPPARKPLSRRVAIGSAIVIAAVAATIAIVALRPDSTGTQAISSTPSASGGLPPTTRSSGSSSAPVTGTSVDLLTPSGIREAITALEKVSGSEEFTEATFYPTYANVGAPVKNKPTLFDLFVYRDGTATRKGAGGPFSGHSTVKLNSINWDILPPLLRTAEETLGIPTPTMRYVIVDPAWTFNNDQPTVLVYLTDDYGGAYLAANTDGSVVTSYPRGR